MEIKEIDRKICELLQQSARMQLSHIAEQVGLSVACCHGSAFCACRSLVERDARAILKCSESGHAAKRAAGTEAEQESSKRENDYKQNTRRQNRFKPNDDCQERQEQKTSSQ